MTPHLSVHLSTPKLSYYDRGVGHLAHTLAEALLSGLWSHTLAYPNTNNIRADTDYRTTVVFVTGRLRCGKLGGDIPGEILLSLTQFSEFNWHPTRTFPQH